MKVNTRRRILSFILALAIVLNSTIAVFAESPDATTESSTNFGSYKRLVTMISLAAGKKSEDLITSYQGMTKDDLRFLGVYLSNYFQPYGTQLGVEDEDDRTKEAMKSTIKSYLSWSDDMAEELTNQILGLARSNSYELVFCVSKDYQTSLIELQNVTLSYATAYQILSGRFKDFIFSWGSGETTRGLPAVADIPEKEREIQYYLYGEDTQEETNASTETESNITPGGATVSPFVSQPKEKYQSESLFEDLYKGEAESPYRWGYFAWKASDGSLRPVFDCGLWGDVVTPSQVAFFKALESVKFEDGYAVNAFDLGQGDFETDTKEYDMIHSLNSAMSGRPEDLAQMTIWGSRMYVDCFGDIVCVGGNHQYIAVPGCMNPYIWQMTTKEGKDDADHPAGSVYNLINAPSLVLQNAEESVKKTNLFNFEKSDLATDKPADFKVISEKKAEETPETKADDNSKGTENTGDNGSAQDNANQNDLANKIVETAKAIEEEWSKDAKKNKWVYKSSAKNSDQFTFADAIKNKVRQTDAADGVAKLLRQAGVLPLENGQLYADDKGKLATVRGADKYKEKFDIKEYDGSKTCKDLIDSGELKAGDVVLYKGHINVYLGDNSYFDTGKTNCEKKKKKHIYKGVILRNNDNKGKPTGILRVKSTNSSETPKATIETEDESKTTSPDASIELEDSVKTKAGNKKKSKVSSKSAKKAKAAKAKKTTLNDLAKTAIDTAKGIANDVIQASKKMIEIQRKNKSLSNKSDRLNQGTVVTKSLYKRLKINTTDGKIKLYPFRGSKSVSFKEGAGWDGTVDNLKNFFLGKENILAKSMDSIKVGLFKLNATDPQIPYFDMSNLSEYGSALKYSGSESKWTVDMYTAKGTKSEGLDIFKGGKKILFTDMMCFVDSLGAFHFDKTNADMDWKAVTPIHYLNKDNKSKNQWLKKNTSSPFSSGKAMGNDVLGKSPDVILDSSTLKCSSEAMIGLYITYAFAGLYNPEEQEGTIGSLGYRMEFSDFPNLSKDPIASETLTDKIVSTRIKGWLYYLLHPSDGFNYIRILFTNKVGATIVSVHNDMLGSDSVGNTVGTTAYKSTIGYVTTPDLTEMEWSSNLIVFFQKAIPYLLIALLVVLAIAFVFKIITFLKGILGFVLFGFCIIGIIPLISSVTGISNEITSGMFVKNFSYWAMVSQESYSKAIDDAAQGEDETGEDYANYLRTLYAVNSSSEYGLNQGGEAVRVKWQAPKKMQSLMYSKNDTSTTKNLFENSFLMGALNKNYSGEVYLEDDESTYLYRSYTDLSNWSRYIYRSLRYGGMNGSPKKKSRKTGSITQTVTSMPEAYQNNVKNLSTYYTRDMTKGYTNGNLAYDNSVKDTLYITMPLSSKIVDRAFAQEGSISQSKELTSLFGISQDFFNFSIPMFNTTMDFHDELIDKAKSEDGKAAIDKLDEVSPTKKKDGNDVPNYDLKEEDYTGLAAYGLYTESPFYFFSWKLYDMGLQPESSTSGSYTRLLLSKPNGGFFYNTLGNGELKDFMDMRSLFTYVIPYLRKGNNIVREWDDFYGLKYYTGIPTEEGYQANMSSADKAQKYWNNLNTARLYNVYSPWVDLMYDCNYAKEEKISFLGKTFTVRDPIDPTTYPAERPMIFSKSEMVDYGLSSKDLTKVEKKILECEELMEEEMYDLLNYNAFSDVTLDTAAAMACTFAFNKTFSQTGLARGNILIQPQSFEISNFSFDAFLRFALSNSTGESILNNEDFYATVVQKSSLMTGIAMLVVDVFSMYLLPGAKILFLGLLMLSTIFMVAVLIFKIASGKGVVSSIYQTLILPLVLFFVINISIAYIISLFMGVASNEITGTNTMTIRTGDPTTVILILILIDAVAIVLYYKILKMAWTNTKSNGVLIASAVTSFVGGIGGTISKSLDNVSNGSVGTRPGASSTASIRATRRKKGDTEEKEDGLRNKRTKEADAKWRQQKAEIDKRTNKQYEKEQAEALDRAAEAGKAKVIHNDSPRKDEGQNPNKE